MHVYSSPPTHHDASAAQGLFDNDTSSDRLMGSSELPISESPSLEALELVDESMGRVAVNLESGDWEPNISSAATSPLSSLSDLDFEELDRRTTRGVSDEKAQAMKTSTQPTPETVEVSDEEQTAHATETSTRQPTPEAAEVSDEEQAAHATETSTRQPTPDPGCVSAEEDVAQPTEIRYRASSTAAASKKPGTSLPCWLDDSKRFPAKDPCHNNPREQQQ
ncbi:hypothetical protein D7B24_000993 [Verticillium nonalfalfae]|uniref:Uncharacterized protein n=1 Tax=Verticillium nonalfalfae TaxID=1051616 RepID=A0A3M9Y3K7_9PEZI|nr:uncharacterized protein D7B24_000993 [Verticillium nonalfalfae]RNJ54018.1 hypothetical protein D7B24_000993 [Verticillium nonalfalfae]